VVCRHLREKDENEFVHGVFFVAVAR
jgi:hypothetical protein